MNFTSNRIPLDDVCFKVYDPEKKELIGTFETATVASHKLGLTVKVIHTAARNKTRRFSPILNKEISIRFGSKTK